MPVSMPVPMSVPMPVPRPTSWLVTGARGQLGQDLLALLAVRPEDEVVGLGRAELDLTDEHAVRGTARDWLARAQADGRRAVCLNAAAYTAVDAAETDEATAAVVNGDAPGWLAQELAAAPGGPARLVHVSTDYVFDGTATSPYPVDAPVAPRSAYGRTKAAGERAVLAAGGDSTVVRTAWVWSRHGTNFVTTMIRLAAEHDTVSVVDDQVGAPTLSADLAAGLVALGERPEPAPPVLHLTGAGETSWHGFARAVFTAIGADPARVLPTTTAAFPRPAPRPAYSVLDLHAWTDAGLPTPRPWHEALTAAFAAAREPAAATQSSHPSR
jgi:dTDP-4-dehydrorhamnose reductase